MDIKGIFASDIDNTLTDKRHLIPDEVVNYLVNLHHDGWQIVFLTGRSFTFAMMSMEKFNIPFVLGVQNGAEMIAMPETKLIYQNFIKRDILSELEKVFEGHSIGYIVYSGFEGGDFCYYQPKKFSKEMLDYFGKLKSFSAVNWTPIDSWDEFTVDGFPLIKCFGPREELNTIHRKIVKTDLLSSSVITDSVDPQKGILLITAKGIDKGAALKRLCKDRGWECPIVAAGDDDNDQSLLDVADVSICVRGGSKALEERADIIANPSSELGIIKAMDQVLSEQRI